MKFVDSVKIHVRSGKGGSGCTSFRREKYIPMGGPDGGDGGKGGDIYFVGDQNRNTLLDLSFQQHQHAGNGSNGMGKDRHGKNGQDLKIHVPLGTMLKEQETGEILLEVLESEEYLLFKGGRGGRGNARFKTSTNRAPEHHQPGEEGVERWIQLELKLMADVGLWVFPMRVSPLSSAVFPTLVRKSRIILLPLWCLNSGSCAIQRVMLLLLQTSLASSKGHIRVRDWETVS